MDAKNLKFVFSKKKKKRSVNITTIEAGAGMIDDRKVTKVIGVINKKWLEGKNRRPKEETEDDQKGTQDKVH